MQRTFIFTVGKALTVDKVSKTVVEKDFRITYSSLNDTEAKIAAKAEKVIGEKIFALASYKHIAELRVMDDDEFYKNSKLDKVSDFSPDEKE